MEDTSACVQQLEGVRLADLSKVMAGSSESVYVTALSESRVETGAEEGESSGRGRSVEEQIEQSKVHWSALAEFDNSEGEEAAEVSNVKEFEELQRHPLWGDFFYKFNQGDGRSTLEVGQKFAEGSSFIATSSGAIQSGMSRIWRRELSDSTPSATLYIITSASSFENGPPPSPPLDFISRPIKLRKSKCSFTIKNANLPSSNNVPQYTSH